MVQKRQACLPVFVRGFVDAYDAKTGRQAWRFGTGNGPEAPGLPAGFRVVSIHEATHACLAAADADDNLAADRERRHGHAVAGFVVADLRGPTLLAALDVERDQVAIERCNK